MTDSNNKAIVCAVEPEKLMYAIRNLLIFKSYNEDYDLYVHTSDINKHDATLKFFGIGGLDMEVDEIFDVYSDDQTPQDYAWFGAAIVLGSMSYDHVISIKPHVIPARKIDSSIFDEKFAIAAREYEFGYDTDVLLFNTKAINKFDLYKRSKESYDMISSVAFMMMIGRQLRDSDVLNSFTDKNPAKMLLTNTHKLSVKTLDESWGFRMSEEDYDGSYSTFLYKQNFVNTKGIELWKKPEDGLELSNARDVLKKEVYTDYSEELKSLTDTYGTMTGIL